MLQNSVAIGVGRLLEIRLDAGLRSEAEVDELFQTIVRLLRQASRDQQLVSVADWRRCPVMEEKAAKRFVDGMQRNNPRFLRSAALVSAESSVAVLQFSRLIRETKFKDRRMFTQVAPLLAWVDEVLDPLEQGRLREFLGTAEGS